MRLTKQSLLWVLVALALIGCQRAPATPTEAALMTKAPPPTLTKTPPTPTPTMAPPTPTTAPLINGNDGQPSTSMAPEVPRVTIEELKAMLSSARNVLVIDTRDPSAYDTAHVRGALNIPYSKIEAGAPQLPRSAKIVLYCA